MKVVRYALWIGFAGLALMTLALELPVSASQVTDPTTHFETSGISAPVSCESHIACPFRR